MPKPSVWTRVPGRHDLGGLFRYCQRLAARSGSSFLYLVPNQGLLRVRGATNQDGRARLMTLQAFAQEVVRTAFPDRILLDDRDRWVIVSRVIDGLITAGALPYAGKIARTPGFVAGVAATIGELKEAGIGPDQFAPEGALEAELARIYTGYEAALADRKLLDSPGVMAAAADALAQGGVARDGLNQGATLPLLDGITLAAAEGLFALTPLHRRLMEALAARLPSVWVEALEEPGEPLFAPIRRSVDGWQVARRSGRARAAAPTADPLDHLELALFRQKQRPGVATQGRVRLVTGPGIEGEAAAVAREVKRLIQMEGIRPDQVALIIPDQQRYGQPVQRALREYGIPVRAAEPVSAYPLGRFVLDLVRLAAGDWHQSGLIRVLRAPYGGNRWLDEATADWLDGEAYSWPPAKQQADWEARLATPGDATRHATPDAPHHQAMAAAARQGLTRLAADLAALSEPRPVRDSCERLAGLIATIGIEHEIIRIGLASPDDARALTRTARELSALQAIDRVLNRMSQVYGLWGDTLAARPDEFYTLLEQELDQESHRADPRPPGPGVELIGPGQAYGRRFAAVFVLGLADGILPGAPRADFLLPERRRQQLGMRTFATRLAHEQLLFLTAVTRAEACLYLTYPSPDESEEFLRSPFLDDLLTLFTDAEQIQPISRELSEVIPGFSRVASRDELALAAARLLGVRADQQAATAQHQLTDALSAGGHLPNRAPLQHAIQVASHRSHATDYSPWEGRLTDPAALARVATLYGEERAISVGDVEKAAICGFRFLGERILRLEPREPWQLREDPREMGSLRHALLAGFWRRWPQPLTREALPDAQLTMTQVLDEQVVTNPTAKRQRAALLRWATSWLEGEAGLAETLKTDTRPRWLELGFGRPVRPDQDPASTDQPLVINSDGQTYRFAGVVDRVDIGADADGPVIIYDYKGSNSRDWAGAVKNGLNLQPMLYASAIGQLFQPGAALAGAAYYYTNKRGKSRADVGTGIWRDDFAAKLQKRGEPLNGEAVAAKVAEAAATAVRTSAAIRAGDFPVAPREACSPYCGLRFVCRRFNESAPFVKGEQSDAVSE